MKKIKKQFDRLLKSAVKHKQLIALSFTPLVLMVVPTLDLYYRNQSELEGKSYVMLPFFGAGLAIFLIGLLLYRFRRQPIINVLLLIYLSLGPLFLFYSLLKKAEHFHFKSIFILVLLVALPLYFSRQPKHLSSAYSFLAVFSVAIILAQSFNAIDKSVLSPESDSDVQQTNVIPSAKTKANLPNIYHVILDQYQTDEFALTLNKSIKHQLKGFTYYPQNTAVYARTSTSVSSVFSNQIIRPDTSIKDFLHDAFNTKQSVLYWLKQKGYRTDVLEPEIFSFNRSLIDKYTDKIADADSVTGTSYNLKLFYNLWLDANAPDAIADRYSNSSLQVQLSDDEALSNTRPIAAYQTFQKLMNTPGALDQPNSYYLIHLLLPHNPFVLRSDCTYDVNKETSPVDQSKCATKAISEFIAKLKSLGRYDNSLIVIHGDHGAGLTRIGDSLKPNPEAKYTQPSKAWVYGRSRALLLIKLPNSSGPLKTSSIKSSLFDIAPTVMNDLDVAYKMKISGKDLNSLSARGFKGPIYFYSPKKTPNGKGSGFYRYIIKNHKAIYDETLPVKG